MSLYYLGSVDFGMKVFEAIDAVRRQLGLTQAAFCASIERDPTTYGKWRRGDAEPNMATLEAIERVHGARILPNDQSTVTIEWLDKGTTGDTELDAEPLHLRSVRVPSSGWAGALELTIGETAMVEAYQEFAGEHGLPQWENLGSMERKFLKERFRELIQTTNRQFVERQWELLDEFRRRVEATKTVPTS